MRWRIVTYDLLVNRKESFSTYDENIACHVSKALNINIDDWVKETKNGKAIWKLDITSPCRISNVDTLPAKVQRQLSSIMKRLQGNLIAAIWEWNPELIIIDEAHKLKNKKAKRTISVANLHHESRRCMLLTGTPLRNHYSEGESLLSILDPKLSSTNMSKEDIIEYFVAVMIRRNKSDVLPELPPKILQKIDIVPQGLEASIYLIEYYKSIEYAHDAYNKAIAKGRSEARARQAMLGGISRARQALGLAKIADGTIADIVEDIAEQKSCALVFVAHHSVADGLRRQLAERGLNVVQVDGRTSQENRAMATESLQSGSAQVFIGTINAAGESITLTRADTVVFVEFDWVPAALFQAEDRGHRVGQTSPHYHIIHVIAKISGPNLDKTMLFAIDNKVKNINSVLNQCNSSGSEEIRKLKEIRGNVYDQVANEILRNRLTTDGR